MTDRRPPAPELVDPMRQQAEAWHEVYAALDRACPGWTLREDCLGLTGAQMAVAAIARLSEQRQTEASYLASADVLFETRRQELRSATLEEAAKACEGPITYATTIDSVTPTSISVPRTAGQCAAAIRALKSPPTNADPQVASTPQAEVTGSDSRRDGEEGPAESASPCVARQTWVPCSERMPDTDDEMLILVHGVRRIACFHADDDCWYDPCNDMMYTRAGVAKWMPLPEAPERTHEGNGRR